MRISFALFAILLALATGSLAACFPNDDIAGSDAATRDGGEGDGPSMTTADSGAPPVTVRIATDGGTPIPVTAFGQNYWDWVDWGNSGVTGLTGTSSLVGALHLGVIRAGGDNNDWSSPSAFDTAQIDAFVAYCQDAGAEPILQVPLVRDTADGGPATAEGAAAIVTYANVTKGYGIRYWEIGNEPDVYSTDFDAGFPIQTADDYCTAFADYVTAMKAANAAGPDGGVPMQFLGPELAYKYVPGSPSTDWLTPFLDGCKDYVDVVTIHRYPFSGAEVTAEGALDDVTSFRAALASVAAVVAQHARPGTPLGVTEANISYDYAESAYTSDSLLAGPGTYPAAMWTADVMGAGLESGLWTLAFWNIGEVQSDTSVLGFIQSESPVPGYYAEQMVSTSLRGTALTPSGVPTGFSIYASHDPAAAATSVLVLNKTAVASTVALAVDGQPAQTFGYPAMSISIVQMADAPGGPTHVLRYTADVADAGGPPQIVQ